MDRGSSLKAVLAFAGILIGGTISSESRSENLRITVIGKGRTGPDHGEVLTVTARLPDGTTEVFENVNDGIRKKFTAAAWQDSLKIDSTYDVQAVGRHLQFAGLGMKRNLAFIQFPKPPKKPNYYRSERVHLPRKKH